MRRLAPPTSTLPAAASPASRLWALPPPPSAAMKLHARSPRGRGRRRGGLVARQFPALLPRPLTPTRRQHAPRYLLLLAETGLRPRPQQTAPPAPAQ